MTHEEIADDMIDQETGTNSWWDLKFKVEALETALADAHADLATEREVTKWFKALKFWRPHALESRPIRETEGFQSLHREGDVRVVYVNEGDWIMCEITLARIDALTKGETDDVG